MNFGKLFVGVALCATLVSGGAQASTLFSNNFDTEAGGLSALNYSGFSNFTVTGQVDVVKTGDFGITCSGSCVDLDGSSGPGALTSSAIAYTAGQLLTIAFDVGGNQRLRTTSDMFQFTANFGQLTDILGFTILSGFTYGGSGDYFGITTLGSYGESISGAAAFKHYELSFTPTANGTLNLYFATPSGDNVGPLLDNVLVLSGAVPEPATWAMMIAGFGLVGSTLRRRRAIAA